MYPTILALSFHSREIKTYICTNTYTKEEKVFVYYFYSQYPKLEKTLRRPFLEQRKTNCVYIYIYSVTYCSSVLKSELLIYMKQHGWTKSIMLHEIDMTKTAYAVWFNLREFQDRHIWLVWGLTYVCQILSDIDTHTWIFPCVKIFLS